MKKKKRLHQALQGTGHPKIEERWMLALISWFENMLSLTDEEDSKRIIHQAKANQLKRRLNYRIRTTNLLLFPNWYRIPTAPIYTARK